MTEPTKMTKKEKTAASLAAWSADRNPKTMSALLKDLDTTINSVSATHGASRDDNLKWAIRLHLANDISNRYDPSKASIQTFVYQSLQRVPRLAAQQRNVVHVPESSDADRRKVDRARRELEDIHEREPTDAELADRSQIDVRRIQSLNNKYGKPQMTLSKFHEEVGGSDPASEGGYDSAVDAAHKDYVLQGLAPQDRKIYNWLSQKDPLAKSDIASRLGVSPPAISRKIKKLEDKFDVY